MYRGYPVLCYPASRRFKCLSSSCEYAALGPSKSGRQIEFLFPLPAESGPRASCDPLFGHRASLLLGVFDRFSAAICTSGKSLEKRTALRRKEYLPLLRPGSLAETGQGASAPFLFPVGPLDPPESATLPDEAKHKPAACPFLKRSWLARPKRAARRVIFRRRPGLARLRASLGIRVRAANMGPRQNS